MSTKPANTANTNDPQENTDEIRKLRATVGQCKAAFTRFELYVKAHKRKITLPIFNNMKQRLKVLEDVWSKYNDAQLEINLLTNKTTEEDFDDELEERYFSLIELVNSLSPNAEAKDEASMTDSNNISSHNKLPSINIPDFTGEEVIKYIPFIQLFNAVVGKDGSLAPVQKLYYLRSHLKKDALAIIEGLPLTDSSYQEALYLLKERYDNPCVLITSHVNNILDYTPIQKGTASSLHEFVSSIKQQISAIKNMNQPVESWDMLLLPILLRKLDQYSSRAYHMDRDKTTLPTVADLMEYLERRASSFEESQRLELKPVKSKPVSLVAVNNNFSGCRYCDNNHKLFSCPKFKMASVTERLRFVKAKQLCKICLNPHKNQCRFRFKCSTCSSREHNSLLHVNEVSVNACAPSSCQGVVLLPTVKVKVAKADGTFVIARGLLDSGSQTSFITSKLKNELNLNIFHKSLNVTTLGQQNTPVSEAVDINLSSNVNSSFTQSIVCSVVDKITSPLPQYKLNISQFIPNVVMADDEFNSPNEISLLLAADVFFSVLIPDNIKLNNGLILQNTKLGYIIAGGIYSQASVIAANSVSNCVLQDDLRPIMERFWEVEALEPSSQGPVSTNEEELCELDFKNNVQLNDGKFQVSLPLNKPLSELNMGADSFSIAIQRLNSLYKKLVQNETLYLEYSNFIKQYINLGHAKLYDINQSMFNSMFFLAYHAVINDSKTTRCRIVFEGNQRSKSQNLSLNDVMYNGKIPQKELFDILIMFRTYKYVFMTDIKSMFRQIDLDPTQKHLQNILWKENVNAPIQCLQLQTVTYGLKASSFLATRCLHELSERFGEELPLAADVLRYNTYIDDVLAGSNSLELAIEVRDQVINLLKKGSFELHKWSANNPALLKDIPLEKQHFKEIEMPSADTAYLKALGISYNVQNDQLKVGVCKATNNNIVWTKREVLRYIGSCFDPLGLISPIVLKAKLFMQALWQSKIDWDDTLSEELHERWCQFYDKLSRMPPIIVNRNINFSDATDIYIIGFCDASFSGFGCCLYARVTQGKNVQVNLICAKSRVAPQKNKLTIPKLELCSALLLAELTSKVSKILNINKIRLYTDSMVALAWIQSHSNKLEPFVKNRVNKIKALTSAADWGHVPGLENPGDLVSREVDPLSLASNNMWWHGPSFLLNSDFADHHKKDVEKLKALEPETPVIGCHTQDSSADSVRVLPIIEGCSSISKMQRIIAYVYRFYNNCKNNLKHKIHGKNKNYKASPSPVTATELNFALIKIINVVQYVHFEKDIQCLKHNLTIKSNLLSLSPFLDGQGSLRLGGRLCNATMPYSQKHPLLLPKRCHVTNLMIQREHLNLLHAGPKLTLFSLSQRYWLINGIREVKKNLHKCVTCFRLKAEAAAQMMGSLPPSRLQAGSPFQTVGIDYCGPFDIKQSRVRKPLITKGYIALFVCFLTKAIHMELVSDMRTETFLAALKRFTSRRGLSNQIFCDNAKTFKGAENQLNALYKMAHNHDHVNKITNHCASQGIQFNFIPSYSPTFGGLWEAGVKSSKYHFKRCMGKSVFTFEEFQTIIVQVEGILNSRPLAPIVTRDPLDFSCLSPGHFLIGRPITSFPDCDYTLVNENRLKFWKQCTQKVQSFWKAWQNCYLVQLQNRPKWKLPVKNLEIGQLVLIKEQTPPLWWPLARISNVFPGKDNKVRVVEILLPNKKKKNIAANKVCLLPIHED